MKKQNENNWQYYGLFLDKDTRDKLISFIDNSKWSYLFEELSKVYLDHCTLLHKSHLNDTILLNKLIEERLDYLLEVNIIDYKLIITHIGISEKAMAFKVIINNSNISCTNKIPHITIGTYKDGKPVDSNNITEWHEIEPIEITAHLKIIYYGFN